MISWLMSRWHNKDI